MKNKYSSFITAGKIILGLVFAYLVYTISDWQMISEIIQKSNKLYLFLTLPISIFFLFVQSLRWRTALLVDASTKPPISVFFRYITIGYFANWFLPGSIGGDVIKTLALGKRMNAVSKSMAAILFSRLLGVTVMGFLFWVGYILSYSSPVKEVKQFFPIVITATIAGVILIVLLFKSNLLITIFSKTKIKNIFENLQHYLSHPRIVFKSFLYTLILQNTSIFLWFLLYLAIGQEIQIGIFYMFIPIVFIVTLIPISINGFGVREGISIFLFTMISGITKEHVLSVNILSYALNFIMAGLGAILFMYEKRIVSEND